MLKRFHSFICTRRVHPLTDCLPSRSWSLFIDPGGWKAELQPGWRVTYWNKCPARGIEPGHGHPF